MPKHFYWTQPCPNCGGKLVSYFGFNTVDCEKCGKEYDIIFKVDLKEKVGNKKK